MIPCDQVYLASPVMTIIDLAGRRTGTFLVPLFSSITMSLARERERMVSVQQLWVSTWGGMPWPGRYLGMELRNGAT